MSFLMFIILAAWLPTLAQKPQIQKPKISIEVVVPDEVPKGTCTEDHYGYLENQDSQNRYTPYTSSQLAEYLGLRLKQGYVITLYPQPKGLLWVEAICNPSIN